MFGFFIPKTFGSCSLKLLSKRCAQCSATKSEEIGEDPDHAREGFCAALLGRSWAAMVLPWEPQPRRRDICMGGRVSNWPPDQQPEGWEAVFSKHVQSCAFLGQGVLGSATELIKGQMSF